MMLVSKKVLIEIFEDTIYHDFIENHRKERNWSYTACIKNLLFERIDALILIEQSIVSNTPGIVESEPIPEIKEEKKDMLKNLNRIRK